MKSAAWSEILELDLNEHIDLAAGIWESIAAVPERVQLADWQRQELHGRLQAYHRDPNSGAPWAEVRQRIARSR